MAVKFVSSIIPTKSWNGCSSFLNRFLSILIAFLCLVVYPGLSQSLSQQLANRPLSHPYNFSQSTDILLQDTTGTVNQEFPDPKDVMFKSMLIPGWGQITNKQIWKVPIVYGMLGGLTWYSVFLNKKYHDYRAAFYNQTQDPSDFRFGQTPPYLAQETNTDFLRSNRNSFRNRRDFIYITIGLAYGLNIIDAYVFAHMRSFDVSENLSIRPSMSPSVVGDGKPGITLSLELLDKKHNR